jgi:hypothetical protein
MLTGWVTNLDRLAQNGILDSDAAADVGGFAPRYIGNPPDNTALNPFPYGTPQMRTQPGMDSLAPKFDEPFASPDWKKWLFGAICVGLIGFGGYKISRLFPSVQKAGNGTVNFFGRCWGKTKNILCTGWDKLKGVFTK